MKKVLIVEDDENIRELITELLETKYQVYTAANGRDGLQTFLDILPDLVITDLFMPKMDGIELVRKIKGLHKNFPVIVMSGADHGVLDMAQNEGADACLKKPFSHIGLLEECKRFLQS